MGSFSWTMQKEIWDAAIPMYYQKGSIAQSYDLKCRIYNTKQQASSIAVYFMPYMLYGCFWITFRHLLWRVQWLRGFENWCG